MHLFSSIVLSSKHKKYTESLLCKKIKKLENSMKNGYNWQKDFPQSNTFQELDYQRKFCSNFFRKQFPL